MMGEYDAGYENCIDSMVRQMEDMQFRIDNLHRESAKLRELVDYMTPIAWYAASERERQRMRELGIEVDG